MTPNEGLGDEPAGSRGCLDLRCLCRHGRGLSFLSRRLRARPNVLAGAQQGVPSRNRYTMTMVPADEDKGNRDLDQITHISRVLRAESLILTEHTFRKNVSEM